MKYVAFLRGINVGGNATVKMEELRKTFESLGFFDVKTLLNSGNVVFATETHERALTKKIEEKLLQIFDRKIIVLIRSISAIQKLIDIDPFKKITITPDTRLYVTFLSEKPHSIVNISYPPASQARALRAGESPKKDFKILEVSSTEICSVLTLSPERNTTDIMNILEKEWGKNITTRNWNTVLKIAKL